MSLKAAEIHARLGEGWRPVLQRLGIAEEFLRNKHGPCPACGGKDRFRFDNKRLRGDFICGQCGAGDGFELLMRVHRWTFTEARRHVLEASGITGDSPPAVITRALPEPNVAARPPARVRTILRGACGVSDCPDAVAYLESRRLWPLPSDCALRAHVGVEYFHEGHSVGRFPALVAAVRDVAGELVTAHITYLKDGRKIAGHEPRKLLSPLTGRSGCAVRLMPTGECVALAEGIETALSAARIDGIPVWAVLNTALMVRFEPPASVNTLILYADRDTAGLLAAAQLMQRLQGRVRLELRVPPVGNDDFNDVITQPPSGGDVHVD